ncbi:MAG: cell division protein ZapD [Gammaproteobacteria bacterium]|nr:cell division protein ZapD [Gammaproteobacteria bacterium]
MPDTQAYEHPLNERMRSFLRLEHLFHQTDFELAAGHRWSSRTALNSIIEVSALVSRAELKNELMKELDRHLQTLESLSRHPGVDAARLGNVRDEVCGLLDSLKAREGILGFNLRGNELLNAVRQRSAIPAGTCDFDLPSLNFWLSQSAVKRESDLRRWLSSFSLLRECVSLCLSLVRQSATSTLEKAISGFFQMTLDGNSPCQLIRVTVPDQSPYFPEISGGRHRTTVRFMEQPRADLRAQQSGADIEFELHRCTL